MHSILPDLIEEEIALGREVNDGAKTLAFLGGAATNVYFPCGTVRLGSDDRAPLDTLLRLRGVEGLCVPESRCFHSCPPPASIRPC